MKKLMFLLMASLFISASGQAQAMLERQVIASAGLGGSIGGANVQSTVGEAVVNTFVGRGTILSQGFHQPIIILAVLSPVDNSDLISGIVIYPNPASVEAQLEFELLENSKVEVFLVNNAGQMVGKQKLEAVKGRVQHLIPLGGRYAAGLYYVVLKVEHEMHTEKLVVQ